MLAPTSQRDFTHKLSRRLSRRLSRYVPTKPFLMRNTRPLVSFTFDDIPESAGLFGADILQRVGARGTFYIAGGLCGQVENGTRVVSRELARTLHEDGHEIGCHTFSHVDVQRQTLKELALEQARNAAFFDDLVPGLRLDNFAYPFGILSLRSKFALQTRYESCRGISPGLNAGIVDLGHVRAVEVYDRTVDWPAIDRLLAGAVRRNGWLVFYTHDVQSDPTSIGCSPDVLERVAARSLQAGCEIVTMREALDRIGYGGRDTG